MIKKAMKRACSLLLCAALAVPATVVNTAQAAAPTMDGHGLTGAWYKAEDGSDRRIFPDLPLRRTVTWEVKRQHVWTGRT